MGSSADSLGIIAVDIVGDYSQLQTDLNAAASAAAEGGAQIAEAFSVAGVSAETAAAQLALFDEAASVPFATEVGQLNLFSGELEQIVPAAAGAAESVGGLSAVLASIVESAQAAALGIANFGTSLLTSADAIAAEEGALGGMMGRLKEVGLELAAGFGAFEAVKAIFEMTGQLQLATVSLTALSGSAEQANARLAELRDMAEEEGLSFPALVDANQRMTALGFSTSETQAAMQAAADSAAAMNKDFESTADTLDRLALSGQVSARFLATLGLSTKDLADTMGVAQDQVVSLFKVLDESTRLQVLTTAIEQTRGFAGLSQQVADTLPHQWQQVKNAFEDAFQSIGSVMEPVLAQFLIFVKSIGQAIDLLTRLAHAAGRFVTGEGFTLPPEAPGGAPAPEQGSKTTISPEEQAAGLQMIVKAQTDAAAAADQQAEAMDRFRAVVPEVTSALGIQIEMIRQQEAAVKSTASEIAAYGNSLEQAGADLTGINVTQAYFDQQMIDAALSVAKFGEMAPPAVDQVAAATERLGKTAEQVLAIQIPDSMAKLNAAYKQLGIVIDSTTGDGESRQIAAYQTIASSGVASLETLGEAWQKISGQVAKLAQTDMPAAVALYDEQISKAQALGATEGQILQLIEQKNQAEITGAEQTGADATQYVVQLQNAKIATQLLIDKSTDLGNLYVGLTNIVTNLWSDFSSGIADAVANGKNFGDTMLSVLKKIEQQILNQLVGYAFKELEDSLLKATGLFQGLGQTAANAAQQAAGSVAGAAGGAAGGAGSLTGTAQTGAGGLGGLTSLGGVGAIGSIVGAISGIIGNFQQAHANKVLGEIEQNTRGCLNVLLQTQGSLTGQGPYAALAAQMATSGPTLATGGGGGTGLGGGITFSNCTFSGLTQDMVNALFASALRQFKAAGG